MKIVLYLFLILAAVYVLSLMGRRGAKGLDPLRGWRYAHRGLHGAGRPENSLAAFRAAVAGGYGAELDVHLLADGGLAVIHDSKLVRTTGAPGRVEELTSAELTGYRLEGTEEPIPTLRQVLEVFDGRTPLIIELKAENNAEALSEAVCRELEGYSGVYCLESFDPRCLLWLRRNRPDLIRGQLSQDHVANKKTALPLTLKFLLTHNMLNFATRPDFIAYDFDDRRTLSNLLCRRLWGIQGVSWTIRSQKDLDTAEAEGWIPIFEAFVP